MEPNSGKAGRKFPVSSLRFTDARVARSGVNNLAQHGHVADAIAYLRNPLPGDRFPLDFVNNLERECRDDETRRELLELAIQEWRSSAPGEAGPEERFAVTSFAGLFSRRWNLLPRELAALLESAEAGIDSLARLCQEKLAEDPFSGCVFVFRSRRETSIRLLIYDGQGWPIKELLGFPLTPRFRELLSQS